MQILGSNNPSIGSSSNVAKIQAQKWNKIFDTNSFSPFIQTEQKARTFLIEKNVLLKKERKKEIYLDKITTTIYVVEKENVVVL